MEALTTPCECCKPARLALEAMRKEARLGADVAVNVAGLCGVEVKCFHCRDTGYELTPAGLAFLNAIRPHLT